MPTVHLGMGTRIRQRWNQPDHSDDRLVGARGDFSPRSLHKRSNTTFTLDNCHRYITPDCLRELYNIASTSAIHPNNSFGIFQVTWASWLPKDLDLFFGIFSPKSVGFRPIMKSINGGYWQDELQGTYVNAEADLDFEYSMALTYPQPVINYQVGEKWQTRTLNGLIAAFDGSYCDAWNSSIDGVYPSPSDDGYQKAHDCGTVRPANVVSISYAWNEVSFPKAYLRRQCLEFLKLGLQGVSVISASADCGPAGTGCSCLDPSTGQALGPLSTYGNFNPVVPASCPYVTSVGGTQIRANGSVYDSEVVFRHSSATHISSSGGGFSNLFDAPEYQKDAIDHYLQRPDINERLQNLTGKFNPLGRGVPDVSSNAANFVAAINGQLMTVFGTSASAPVFASILTKINDARLHVGKKPVGFVNPVLYSHATVMTDIVEGSNYGCGVEGFHAGPGWDPVTGLGTPDYKKLLTFHVFAVLTPPHSQP
ncbi:aorsin precursor [Colletotrichum lupini]|uniref:Aorsin n=1 Tax=Colletotrichum lupini TaxID=145971 RepID=A0A9Q8WP79_9PEZI|nr:aorsin precursor [Colletotrichum lupini]UQC90639.1 aorsin precursor [Colletotrichum lupini]